VSLVRIFLFHLSFLGGAGPLKPVAPAWRLAKVETLKDRAWDAVKMKAAGVGHADENE